jgi:hypothetical protein
VGKRANFSPDSKLCIFVPVQAELCQSSEARVHSDFVLIQQYSLFLEILRDVGIFLVLSVYSFWPPTGLLLDFQEGVDVLGKEPVLLDWVVPHFLTQYPRSMAAWISVL